MSRVLLMKAALSEVALLKGWTVMIQAGSRLRSVVCSTEIIVVRAPDEDVIIECGGSPMVATFDLTDPQAISSPNFMLGTQLGKRYSDEKIGIEVLCTKAGEGSLSIAGGLLLPKEAKPLPSSD